MYPTHRTMVIHSHSKQTMTTSKDTKAVGRTVSHFIDPIDLILICQHHVRFINVWDTFSHGDILMGQMHANVKANRSYGSDKKTRQKQI